MSPHGSHGNYSTHGTAVVWRAGCNTVQYSKAYDRIRGGQGIGSQRHTVCDKLITLAVVGSSLHHRGGRGASVVPIRSMPKRSRVDEPVPAVVMPAVVVNGGSASASVIVEPTRTLADGSIFCAISKGSSWLCMLTCGVAAGKRPLVNCSFTDMLKDKLRAKMLTATVSGAGGDSVASLGLDDDDEVDTHAFDGARQYSRPSKRKRLQLNAFRCVGNDIVQLDVLAEVGSDEVVKVDVLNNHLKDSIWLRCDTFHIEWLRKYIRSEIGVHVSKPVRNVSSAEPNRVFWCSAASSWRVSCGPGMKLKNFYVARSPADTYTERVRAAHAKAKEYLSVSSNQQDGPLQ